MSVWMPVIDKMFVYKLTVHNLFAVAAHIENSLAWPNLLSHRAFITCGISAHTKPLELLQAT